MLNKAGLGIIVAAGLGMALWAGFAQTGSKANEGLPKGARAPAFDVTDTMSGRKICYV